MPTDTALNDDFIIDLLEKDATAGRFGGLSAQKRDKNAPKPNTRFLRHIVREADSHNAALLAKESDDSRARLEDLGREVKRKRDDRGSRGRDEKRKKDGERSGRWANAFGGLARGNEATNREKDRREKAEGKSEKLEAAVKERDHSRDRKSRDDRREDDRRHRKHRQRRSHGRLSRSRSRSPERRSRSHRRERSIEARKSPSGGFRVRGMASSSAKQPMRIPDDMTQGDDASDSDPLDAFLGPPPPPNSRPRGRGANAIRNSNMDLCFNDPSYDPRADILPNDDNADDDDWGTALEAMRDRAKWRSQGATRLREAGFSEQNVAKWEGNGREKDERDVRWSTKAEGREWDKGKVLDEDGGVFGKAAWIKGISS